MRVEYIYPHVANALQTWKGIGLLKVPISTANVSGLSRDRLNQVSMAIYVNGVDPCNQNSKGKDDHNFGVERAILRQSPHTRPRTKGERDTLRLGSSGRLQQKITSTGIRWVGETRAFNLCRRKLVEWRFACNRAMSASICTRVFFASVIAW